MLIEFRVENHRSLRSEQALSFEAARIGDDEDARARTMAGHSAALLPVVALYGANASGKSNVLTAMAFVRDAVLSSHRSWAPEGGVPREPFAWAGAAAEPSLFEVTILVEGIRYQYGFVADDACFVEEWLYAWPMRRKQVWFEREAQSFKFGSHLRGENRLVEQVTRPNALFLSAAVQHGHEQLAPIYRWFGSVDTVNVQPIHFSRRGRSLIPPVPSDFRLHRLLDESYPYPERRQRFLSLLREADVGIVDLKQELGGDGYRVLLRHSGGTGDNAWLALEQESQGTLTLCRSGPVLLDALENGSLVLVDELEASLHPLLGRRLVRLFTDPRTNPHNAQLLFTTHDTTLLGTATGGPLLRRDQIWLCEKDPEGATTLYPLTDFKPRKAENLQRGYLQGRYGAIPFVGDLADLTEEE